MLRKVITENQAKICITLKLISSLSPIIKKGMTCIQQINHCIAQYTCMALNVGRYEGTFTRTSNIVTKQPGEFPYRYTILTQMLTCYSNDHN